jgi:hypothetical protein
VAGWQWDQSKEDVSAVILVPGRVWQWQYWRGGGSGRWQCHFTMTVVRGVAVAGWQWDQVKEEVSAVILVPGRGWQWQYWRGGGRW